MYGISNQFGVSVTELAELNNIKGSNLQVGQVINIPSKSGTNPNNLFMYIVVKGDSLYKIAQKYNTTVQAIIDLNYLKNTNLSVGQILRIPEMYTPEDQMVMPSYKNYTVKRGDSLYKIALENDISIDTIKKDNSLTSNTLRIGQVLRLRLPASQMVSVEECFGEDYIPPSDNLVTYTVKKGDNLYNIARNYNTTVSAILNLNNLSSANLSIGQQLKIPTSSATNNTVYTVKKGDNLYDIAKKYNTTVDIIKRKNNLTSNLLQIGQKLNI